MRKITYFDVEYANSKNKSICQIGLLCKDFDTRAPILPDLNIFINPLDGFDEMCIRVHGISAERVKSAPRFSEVWPEISCYFTNAIVVGHNVAGSDLDALVKTLKRYNLDIPELYYVCTLELAKKFVPRFAVQNYGMASLCSYFKIGIESAHNAYDDASANAELFSALAKTFEISPDQYVKKYIPHESNQFISFVSNPVVRKAISEFYGMIRGFSIDNEINDLEIEWIKNWKSSNLQYSNFEEYKKVFAVIDNIVADGIVTIDELASLQRTVKTYLDVVSTAPVTLATQILDGIMKGIAVDGVITEAECKNLRQWLYDNIYLSGHFPFDKILHAVEIVLEDSTVTRKESELITNTIAELLNPVDALKGHVNSVEGKHVCLSGNFSYGQKSDVADYLRELGGIVEDSVKKSTDILMIGNCECQAYSNGTYGTKVKKAIEYNTKGCSIQIIKESDFFKSV